MKIGAPNATPAALGRPLWAQLRAAAYVLQAVRAGGSTAQALNEVAPQDRAAAQALAFRALRRLGTASALRALLAPRRPPPAADALMCLVLALASEAQDRAPYPAYTLLNQGVEAAKRQRATRAQAGFLNACWRRYLDQRVLLDTQVSQDEVARWNHPQWWIDRLRDEQPATWAAILEADLRPGPMTLRVNRRATSRAAYVEALEALDMAARASGEDGLVLARACAVEALPGFRQGWVSVQDAAAQWAAPLIEQALGGSAPPARQSASRWRILDACAAPGGKTAHLLERLDAEVLALDIDPQRCARTQENLARLRLQARVQVGDAAAPAKWWDGRRFDAILLDAPCTASGIVRRHPDVLWLRRPTDVAQLAARQAQLLAALWPLLEEGGVLLYATCSVFRAEGEGQIEAFLAHNTDALRLDAPGHLLPRHLDTAPVVSDNAPGDHDGFFYALLRKQGAARQAARSA